MMEGKDTPMMKVDKKYIFTNHAMGKMRHYGISESLVKRTIRHPDRTEEAILSGMVAAMKRTQSKAYPEVWVMYTPLEPTSLTGYTALDQKKKTSSVSRASGGIKIITAWRYPGESPERSPVPESILEEVRDVIGF